MLGENIKDTIYRNLAKEFIYDTPTAFSLNLRETIYQEYAHSVVDLGTDVVGELHWKAERGFKCWVKI